MTGLITKLKRGIIEVTSREAEETTSVHLTRRDQKVIALLLSEYNTANDIARILGVAASTSKVFASNVAHKVGENNRISLVRWALEHGLREFVIATPELLPVPVPMISALTPESLGLLTRRDRRILPFVADGYSDKEIAATLDITKLAAKTLARRICQKLGTKNRATLAAAWLMTQRNSENPSTAATIGGDDLESPDRHPKLATSASYAKPLKP